MPARVFPGPEITNRGLLRQGSRAGMRPSSVPWWIRPDIDSFDRTPYAGVAQEFAAHGHSLLLGGRDQRELSTLASDLAIRCGVNVATLTLDVLNFEDHEAALRSWLDLEGDTLDGVVLCVGYLGDQAAAQADFAEARQIIETNLTGCVSVLNFIANEFESRRSG